MKERGAVGETILHLCLLNASSLHADLAKRLLKFYPKLIMDIYLSDEYYGESVLHIAIVNEDPAMVKYLLDANAYVEERYLYYKHIDKGINCHINNNCKKLHSIIMVIY